MNDEVPPRGPGRPRVYDKPSQKIDAFRKRLDTAGFLRKEVLVQKSVWLEIQALAKRRGVSTVDAASGLLEHGLMKYLEQGGESQLSSRVAKLPPTGWRDSTLVGGPGWDELMVEPRDRDPISRFLEKRKEISNENETL